MDTIKKGEVFGKGDTLPVQAPKMNELELF